MRKVLAKDIMQSKVVVVGPDDPLESVHRLFIDEEISGAPVVNDGGRVLGVVSIRDLLGESVDEEASAEQESLDFYRDGEQLEEGLTDGGLAVRNETMGRTVADVMTPSVVSVEPSTPVTEVARKLLEHRVHRVLVVESGESDDVLVGNISLFDLAKVVAAADDD